MRRFRSYRAGLQVAFLALGLGTMGVAVWMASRAASDALREATFERLDGVRHTRARQIERYFEEAGRHLNALASDVATAAAVEAFQVGWEQMIPTTKESERYAGLEDYYRDVFVARSLESGAEPQAADWFPADPRTQTLQALFLAENPHPVGAKDLLSSSVEAGAYGAAHEIHHPVFRKYLQAFGYYDIFLVDAKNGVVVYTVFKEIDLGVSLHAPPYADSPLGLAVAAVMQSDSHDSQVIRDYRPYGPSYFSPAAFLAAPVVHNGEKVGVIAVQVSIDEVNRVMTGGGKWEQDGLGTTGQAYIVGSDRTLRSDLRYDLTAPGAYLAGLRTAGVPKDAIDKLRRQQTAILVLEVKEEEVSQPFKGNPALVQTIGMRGQPVLRARGPLLLPGLEWSIIAEIDEAEAFEPVSALQRGFLLLALVLTLVVLMVAQWLADSATQPIQQLVLAVQRIGRGDRSIRIEVDRADEIATLAHTFNEMAENLEQTTVSRAELEILAGRLITAQESERKRIARELHDDFSQRLAALAIEAGGMAKESESLPPKTRARLENVRQQAARLGDDIHGVSHRLHPTTLEDLGLRASMESECRAYFERGGPPVELDLDASAEHLPPEARLCLFRVLQESLRNVEKHADASQVNVTLRVTKTGVLLTIRDDGVGFAADGANMRAGLGLASLAERARLLRGNFQFSSSPGQGTTLTVSLPAGDP